MQVWCLHNPTRYAFVAAEGPVVLFEFAPYQYCPAGEGVKLEDQFLVTETGVEVLSRLPFEEAWL